MKRRKQIYLFAAVTFAALFLALGGKLAHSIHSVSAKESRNTAREATPLILDNGQDAEQEMQTDALKGEELSERPKVSQIEGFPLIIQNPELPTGCEITALTMILNYYGYPADKIEMARQYLPKTDTGNYYGEDGLLYGNALNDFFIGDPFSAAGITCGIGALKTAAEQYLQNAGSSLNAYDMTGTAPEELYDMVENGEPILVLITISMAERWETQGWYTENGSYVDWSQNDHGTVLIGYSEFAITIADPIAGIVEYPREDFENVYRSRGQKCMKLE